MKIDSEVKLKLLSRFSADEVLSLMYQAGFKEPKKLDVNQKGFTTIRCCGHPDEEIPKKGKRASCIVNVNSTYYKCKSCDESGDLFTVAGKICNGDFPEAVQYLADLKGFDLGLSNDDSNRQKPTFAPIVQKAPERIKYYIFDPEREFKHYDSDELINNYSTYSDLLKFKAIMTVIIRHSMSVDQTEKLHYLSEKRKIDLSNPRVALTGFLPLKKNDFEFWKMVETTFPIEDLIRFGFFSEGKDGNKAYWKHYYRDFIVFPSQDLYSDLYHGCMLRPTVPLENSSAKEMQLSNPFLIDPIPFGLTRNTLLSEQIILITEGGIDGLSTNIPIAANPGVNSYCKEYLGFYRGKTIIVGYDMDEAGLKAMHGYDSVSVSHKKNGKLITKTRIGIYGDTDSLGRFSRFCNLVKKFRKQTLNITHHQGLIQDLKDVGVTDIISLSWDTEICGKDWNEMKKRLGKIQQEFLIPTRH